MSNTNVRPANASNENGLARWRKRTAEEKEAKMKELAKLRKKAVTVDRDGQKFKLVVIPDKYLWGND